MIKVFTLVLILSCGLGASQVLRAGELLDVPDPTRPPVGMRPASALHGLKDGATASASAASDAASAVPAGPALTGIRVDRGTGQAVALIGDDVVGVGDRVAGGAVVTAITRDRVTIRGKSGLRTLQLDEGLIASSVEAGSPQPAPKKSRRKERP